MRSVPIKTLKIYQLGLSGVLICGLVAIGLVISAIRLTAQANMDSYHSPNKVKIEIAGQLSHSGLKYSKYILDDGDRVLNLFQPFQSNANVTLACSSSVALPNDLVAKQTVYSMPTPLNGQEIKLNGVIAPYDCNLPLSKTNYRLTLEVVGSVDCNLGAERADSCVTRSIVQTAHEGVTYNPIITPPPVLVTTTTQTTPALTCPTGPFTPATEAIHQQIRAVCAAQGVTIEDYSGPAPAPTITAPPVTTTTTTTTSTATPPSGGSGSGGAVTKDNTVGM